MNAVKIVICPKCNTEIDNKSLFGLIRCSKCKRLFRESNTKHIDENPVKKEISTVFLLKNDMEFVKYEDRDNAGIKIFEKRFRENNNEIKNIFDNIVGVSPMVAELVDGLKKTETISLKLSKEITEKLKSGEYSFMRTKDGILKAEIIDLNQKGKPIVQHCDLEIKEVCKGVDMKKLLNSMQSYQMQKQLEQISQQLDDISNRLNEVLRGQQNDRIALYYSGLELYLDSMRINDETFRKDMLSLAIKTLKDSNEQMIQQVKSDIKVLLDKFDIKSGKIKGISIKDINDRMTSINKAFEVIHKNSILSAGIYYENNEIKAMLGVLERYSGFLQQTLLDRCGEYSVKEILYQYDENDKALEGSWYSRSTEIPKSISRIKEELSNPQYNWEIKMNGGDYNETV